MDFCIQFIFYPEIYIICNVKIKIYIFQNVLHKAALVNV